MDTAITEPRNIADEYNVSQALLNCHPTDRAVLLDAFNRVHEANVKTERVLRILQDSIGDLRLDFNYLNFDLEATRRERDAAVAELERLR